MQEKFVNILLLFLTPFMALAKTEHMKADYHFHIYNETGKPVLVSFFIAEQEFAPAPLKKGDKDQGKQQKIGSFNNLINAHTDQKIKLGEFGWFTKQGMGYGPNKVVDVLNHRFADSMKFFVPGTANTEIIRRINLEQKKQKIYITEDTTGKVMISNNQQSKTSFSVTDKTAGSSTQTKMITGRK